MVESSGIRVWPSLFSMRLSVQRFQAHMQGLKSHCVEETMVGSFGRMNGLILVALILLLEGKNLEVQGPISEQAEEP